MQTTPPPVTPIASRGYAHPEMLVSTEWVDAHRKDPDLRLLECNEDLLLYDTGHIPGAVKIDWVQDLNHPLVRDYLEQEAFQRLLRRCGIDDETTTVFYGDRNNWWAAYAHWVFQLFGLERLRIMDGGRQRWLMEGRPMTTRPTEVPAGSITVGPRSDGRARAFRGEVLAHVGTSGALVDVRSIEEYRGERLHMPDYPNEGALRGGHIPGARSIPWARAVDPATHTFLPADALRAIYVEEQGLHPDEPIIAYCRIGERSSHTWFVLTFLLGFPKVRNYDGSWTEWGNSVGLPIARP